MNDDLLLHAHVHRLVVALVASGRGLPGGLLDSRWETSSPTIIYNINVITYIIFAYSKW